MSASRRRLVSLSKRLSYVLRHRPDSIGIRLDEAGWIELDELLAAMNERGSPMTREDVDAIRSAIPKQRFEIVDGRIRAAQGHSLPVDLGLSPETPPVILYHGTVTRSVPSIFSEGLQPRQRQHVHLSADRDAARAVGSRRGRPVLLVVAARRMHAHGYVFHVAANGVWLTAHVPPEYLSEDTEGS